MHCWELSDVIQQKKIRTGSTKFYFIFFIFSKLVLTNPVVVCACNAFIIYNTSLFLLTPCQKRSSPRLFFFNPKHCSKRCRLKNKLIVNDFDSCFLVYYLYNIVMFFFKFIESRRQIFIKLFIERFTARHRFR